MKTYLQNLIANKEARCNEIKELIKASQNIDEVRSLGTEKETLENEIVEARNQLAKIEKTSFNPVATYGQRSNENSDVEYRMAFAKHVVNGTAIPTELRANTLTSNVGAAIPENLLPQIIEKIETYGNVLPLITRTSYAVGQTIAVDGLKPVASWVAEGAGSDRQNKELGASIVFGAYKVRCEISFSQEVSVQTLPAFEALFIKQVGEAMAKAIEAKIVSNNAATGSPRGILAEAGTTVTVTELDYATLCAFEGELPEAYEANAKWFMNKKTFMKVYALVDSNGQPIARVNYGIAGKPERYILGRDVVITEHLANDDLFIFDPADYVLNTSYDLGIQRKQDWDTEDHLVKAVMSVDGKVVDSTSLVKKA